MNLALLLEQAATAFGHRPAIALGDVVLHDYRNLGARVETLAGSLQRKFGLRPGSRVGLFMENRPCYLEILFAVWRAGMTAVPLNAKLHGQEAGWILSHCEAELVFHTASLGAALAKGLQASGSRAAMADTDSAEYAGLVSAGRGSQLVACEGREPAWIFYTSGTTGKPKGAVLSHRNLLMMTTSYLADVDALTEQDALLHLAAQSHASGLFALSFVAKAANNVLPASGGFDTGETARLVNRWGNASFFMAPTMLRTFCADPAATELDPARVRTLMCGGAPVYLEDVRMAVKLVGPKFWNGYGQGECPCSITAMPKHLYADPDLLANPARITSVGLPRSLTEVRVVDPAGNPVAPGEVGEVVARGDIVMSGYHNDADATAKALRDGWLWTGDLGTLDERGFLYLKDRSKDLIISGGSNIYPREVEEVLLTHPAIAEVAVVGEPDAKWGENVIAFVVAVPGAMVSAEELDALCLAQIARFKRPKRYVFLERLPKNNYGKVLKRELRESLGARTK